MQGCGSHEKGGEELSNPMLVAKSQEQLDILFECSALRGVTISLEGVFEISEIPAEGITFTCLPRKPDPDEPTAWPLATYVNFIDAELENYVTFNNLIIHGEIDKPMPHALFINCSFHDFETPKAMIHMGLINGSKVGYLPYSYDTPAVDGVHHEHEYIACYFKDVDIARIFASKSIFDKEPEHLAEGSGENVFWDEKK